MDSENQEMSFTNLLSQDEYLVSLDGSPPLPPNIPTNINKCARARGTNFTIEEDMLLVSAWLNCSIDAIKGTDQKHSQLWEKIYEYFQEHQETTERTINSLIHRWSCIQRATNKFCAKLAQVERLNQSGMTEQDKLEKAKIMYRSLEKSNFQFEHCWRLLKNQAKWISRPKKDVPKQRRVMVPPPTPTPTTIPSPITNAIENDTIELDRPMGRKAEKRKRKDQGKQAEDNIEFRRIKYTLLEESRVQEKEFYRLKVAKMEFPAKLMEYLKKAGFSGVLQCYYDKIDQHLVTSLVERWRPETHTFHFPFGEATVTLEDVQMLWGLPLGDEVISGTNYRWSQPEKQQICEHLLGLTLEDPEDLTKNTLKMSTLLKK
ncbi:hypothetical protein SSX86_030635 [Deinandra increscens subsp. villosa]|uniref:Uncharacterized protein n=1 Tax=Deinandra increscens subsp. villosa TaxID=3103831 RepID=A0AAP0C666_9ASTR